MQKDENNVPHITDIFDNLKNMKVIWKSSFFEFRAKLAG